MSQFEDDVILLTDDTGEDIPFEIIDTLELDGSTYALLAPLDEDDDDGVLVFQIIEKDEGIQYESVDDEHLMQRVFDVFRSSDEDYEFCDAE
ncbi:MAG: DUF1292 domain-containing protein [Clostridia bacterium]|nr:DUF1292 domain-containing protein [Clostridia bacterium]